MYVLHFSILLPSTIKFFQCGLTYHKEARVGVDHLGLVAGLQVPEDGRIVEEGQVDHVLAFLEFGGVNPANLGLLVGEFLMSHGLRIWIKF